LLLLTLIWFGPLLGAWRESFAAGMIAYMGVIAIAAPLIVIGLPKRWRPGPSMPAPIPVLASLAELVAVWAGTHLSCERRPKRRLLRRRRTGDVSDRRTAPVVDKLR
jgi:putative membrane protein